MMTEVCAWLRNWFKRAQYIGEFMIQNGVLRLQYSTGTAFDTMKLADGQYFRIINSTFNDGVHKVGDALTDEVFTGAVWAMAPPPAFLAIIDEIEAWAARYQTTDALSPYTSESFGGYSYSKSGSGYDGGGTSWKTAFGGRLSPWRKI